MKGEIETMATNKEMIADKEITREELADIVKNWQSKGGSITECADGVALNFRMDIPTNVPIPKHIRKIRAARKKT